MDQLLIGNIISLFGSLVMVSTGLIKSKKGILTAQCVMFVLLAAANLILGGVPGAIVDGISILRNVVSFFVTFTLGWRLGFIAVFAACAFLPLMLGITHQITVLDLFPAISCGLFTWFINAKDGVGLKVVIIITQLMWCFYDGSIRNYTALLFDVLTILSNIIGIIMIKRDSVKKIGG